MFFILENKPQQSIDTKVFDEPFSINSEGFKTPRY